MGMIGRCPTVDLPVTVTERWVAENLQNSVLLPMTQVTLKAANGLESPYSGVVTVDLDL